MISVVDRMNFQIFTNGREYMMLPIIVPIDPHHILTILPFMAPSGHIMGPSKGILIQCASMHEDWLQLTK